MRKEKTPERCSRRCARVNNGAGSLDAVNTSRDDSDGIGARRTGSGEGRGDERQRRRRHRRSGAKHGHLSNSSDASILLSTTGQSEGRRKSLGQSPIKCLFSSLRFIGVSRIVASSTRRPISFALEQTRFLARCLCFQTFIDAVYAFVSEVSMVGRIFLRTQSKSVLKKRGEE